MRIMFNIMYSVVHLVSYLCYIFVLHTSGTWRLGYISIHCVQNDNQFLNRGKYYIMAALCSHPDIGSSVKTIRD